MFSTMNTFNSMNKSLLKTVLPVVIGSNYTPAFFYYTCDSHNFFGLLNQTTGVYDGVFSNKAIISTINPAVASSCLTMNADNFITLPTYQSSSNGFSFCCWVKTNTNARYSRVIEYQKLRIYIDGSTLVCQTGTDGKPYYLTGVMNDNVWRHFSFVFNSNMTITTYVNGVLYSTNTIIANQFPSINNIGYLGKSTGPDPLFIGSLDDIRLYDNLILNAEQAKNVYLNKF